ncbi:MAG: hypothetical protein IKD96_02725 [Oscillospiraceae bacterium]|nr:hypothetical protein [Oscillospiraceae bacterium]
MKSAKKLIALAAAAVMLIALLAGCGSAGPEPPAPEPAVEVKQTASAWLDQDGSTISATVDLTGGWSVEFARGAVYLYDSEDYEHRQAIAMGLTLDKEVYDEYAAEAAEAESFRELENGCCYTQSDGTQAYLSTVGDDAYFMVCVNPGADGDAIYARFETEPENPGEPAYGQPSELYSPEDLDSAAMLVAEEFSNWAGCEMHRLDYAGDACSSEENIQWLNSVSEGKNYTQCMEFLSDFHSPVDPADLEGTAWEPDTDYTDYQWWLAREDGGNWELVSWGY